MIAAGASLNRISSRIINDPVLEPPAVLEAGMLGDDRFSSRGAFGEKLAHPQDKTIQVGTRQAEGTFFSVQEDPCTTP